MLPESGASAGQVRTVTSLCVLRTRHLVKISVDDENWEWSGKIVSQV